MRILRRLALEVVEAALMLEERCSGEVDVKETAPLSPMQSSCRRSQLRHPLGRPSHLTYHDKVL